MINIKSGIYIIENLINHKKYIGSSNNIIKRFQYHKCVLRQNKHHTHYLQNAWNKYGEENFEFYILLECDQDMLLAWEKEAFRLFKCCEREFGYNLGLNPTTTEHSEETKTKIGIGNKGKKVSLETRKKLSLAQVGKTKSPESVSKTRIANTGKKRSLEYCKKMSLIKQNMSDKTRKKLSLALKGKPWSEARRLAYENNKTKKDIII